MKKYTKIMCVASVAAFVLGIGTGYLKGEKLKKEKVVVENVKEAVNEEESVIEEKKEGYYSVQSVDEYVYIYEVFNDKSKKEIGKASMSVFLPDEEADMLKKGINFTDKEDALMVMESLTS